MGNTRAVEMFEKVAASGGLLDYGPDRTRLLIQVARELARGEPVPVERIDRIIADLEIDREDAYVLLAEVAERDADGNIVGALPGLTLSDTSHRFSVDGVRLSTWCAADALILPSLLDRPAVVESQSPETGAKVSLTISPQRLEHVEPAGAVVSMVIVDPDDADMSSVQAIWGTFCHHIYFFPSRDEAAQWSAGRDDIDILSVEEAFELVQRISSRFLAYAA